MIYTFVGNGQQISVDLSRITHITELCGTYRIHLDSTEVIEYNYAVQSEIGSKIQAAWIKWKGAA